MSTPEHDDSVVGSIVTIRRNFTDATGVAWTVEESSPRVLTLIPRQSPGEPRSQDHLVSAAKYVTRALGVPCLHFESPNQRRRLAPIPSGWEDMQENGLEDLLSASTVMSDV